MTPGARDQRLLGISRALAQPQHLRWHSIRQRAQLLGESPALGEEPPMEITVGKEPDERLRLSGHAAEPLAPHERQEPGRYRQDYERQQRDEACEPPDEPTFDTPEQWIDDEPSRHLVRGFLLLGSPESPHDLSRDPDLVQVDSVALDPSSQLGHTLWLALGEVPLRPHDLPLPRQRLLGGLT